MSAVTAPPPSRAANEVAIRTVLGTVVSLTPQLLSGIGTNMRGAANLDQSMQLTAISANHLGA
jgi:hypothetical protein